MSLKTISKSGHEYKEEKGQVTISLSDYLIQKNLSPKIQKMLTGEGAPCYKILYNISDDSSSMNEEIKSNIKNTDLSEEEKIFGEKKTRWTEARDTTLKTYELFSVVCPSGVFRQKFLNKEGANIRNVGEIEAFYRGEARGGTPSVKVFRDTLNEIENLLRTSEEEISPRDLKIHFGTDGVPQSIHYEGQTIEKFEQELEYREDHSFLKQVDLNIQMCTDDDNTVSKYRVFDEKFTNLEVVDDFESERKLIEEKDISYSKEEHNARLYASPRVKYWDLINEEET